jgi:Fe-S-cluster-containing dehydrogenase component/anaerobic selenocysteine-containing dehydrogenase
MSAPFRLPVVDGPLSRGVGGATSAGEFAPGASAAPSGIDRRDFLRVAAASLAAAGLSGCWRTPDERIVAYGRRPPELTPGNPLHYATAWTLNGHTVGLLVTAREGRPVKIEGNPDHPMSLGSTGVFEQAALLQLYDAQRAKRFRLEGTESDADSVLKGLAALATRHEKDHGRRLRFLLEPGASPLLSHLRARILERFPEARIDAYCAITRDAEVRGAELAFGRHLEATPKLEHARVVVSLGNDFLSARPGTVRACRDFAAAREPGRDMNRLYVAEPSLTVTGGFADHRLRVRPSMLPELALALAAEVAKATGHSQLAGMVRAPDGLGEYASKWAVAAARDLASQRGQAVVLAGESAPDWVHALAHAINDALDAAGKTVALHEPAGDDARTGPEVLARLVAEIDAGLVDTLVITADNPVFTAPSDVAFGDALARVPHTIYWPRFEDETSARCRTWMPAAHFLESWGDARAFDGTATIIQPLIQPIFQGVSEADVLSPFAGVADQTSHDLLKSFWRERVKAGDDFQDRWEDWLAHGVIPGTRREPVDASLRWEAIAAAMKEAPRPAGGALELHLVPDAKVFDGRFAMNAWLQELPDPITKNAWDNAALVSPRTAKRLGVDSRQRLELTSGGQTVQAVTYVLPGQTDDVVSLSLGYGGLTSARHGERAGFDGYRLRRLGALWSSELTVRALHDSARLANTQHHGTMEGRPIALEKTLADHHAHPDALASMRATPTQLYSAEPDDPGVYRWAMAIDLNRCTGCSACVLACQSENNIPCVGKANVDNGREMHWLRIDRYFTGELDDPGVITQPMACQHCEAAPCEYVCPVNATVHSDEGLNEMVYNRCVGTRYCSNNCPYKVRRFNYLDYHRSMPETAQMLQNPDVTVRARGVMEKCTYCVQRIERARITSQLEHRAILDGEVLTACQQACPTRAIAFGSIGDREAHVTRQHESDRRYDVLGELGTRPRTGYLARIKNPNPELAS